MLQGPRSVRDVEAVCSSGLKCSARAGIPDFAMPLRCWAGQGLPGKCCCAGDSLAGDVFDRSNRPRRGDLPEELLAVGGNKEYLLAAGESVDPVIPAMLGGFDIVGVVCRLARGMSSASDSSSVDTRNHVLDLRFSKVLLRRASNEDEEFENGNVRSPCGCVSSLGKDACLRTAELAVFICFVESGADGEGCRSRIVFGSLPSWTFWGCSTLMEVGTRT